MLESNRVHIETKGTALLFVTAKKILEADKNVANAATIWVTHKTSSEFASERTRTPDEGAIVGEFSECGNWYIGYAPRAANAAVDIITNGDIPTPQSGTVRLILLYDGDNEIAMDVPLDVVVSVGDEFEVNLMDEGINSKGGVA